MTVSRGRRNSYDAAETKTITGEKSAEAEPIDALSANTHEPLYTPTPTATVMSCLDPTVSSVNPSALALNAHPQHGHSFFPAPEPANLTHDLGYCGPAALGLIFYQLLHDHTITPTAFNGYYATPIHTVQRIISQLYPSLPHTLDTLIPALASYDAHQIQWIFAPVFRVLLLCILHGANKQNSDAFFCDEENTYFTHPPWGQNQASYISDQLITAMIEHLKRCNQSSVCFHEYDFDITAHHCSPLQQDDLLVLSRFLNLKLDIQLACDCTEEMQNIREYLTSQNEKRMLDQCTYFGQNVDTFVTVRIFYYSLITSEQGISGHYDLIKDESLTQKIHLRLVHPTAPPTRQQLQTQALNAHRNPDLWLSQQPQNSSPSQTQSESSDPASYDHWLGDLLSFSDFCNPSFTATDNMQNRCDIAHLTQSNSITHTEPSSLPSASIDPGAQKHIAEKTVWSLLPPTIDENSPLTDQDSPLTAQDSPLTPPKISPL